MRWSSASRPPCRSRSGCRRRSRSPPPRDRVFGRRRPLGGRRAVVILAQLPQARGRRLEADVGGDQVPARGGLGADPAGAQVRLGAGAVFAADVDADAAEGRFGPGRHRLGRGGAAGVEAEAGEDGAADRGGGGRLGGAGRARAGGAKGVGTKQGLGRGPLAVRGDDDRPPLAEDRPGGAALFLRGRPR